MNITRPAQGSLVVELNKGSIPVPGKAHDTFTSGTVLSVNGNDANNIFDVVEDKSFFVKDLLGLIVNFRAYKDDCRLSGNRALIEIKDILGYDIEAE